MISNEVLSELTEESFDRGNLKRSCSHRKEEKTKLREDEDSERESIDESSSEDPADNSSDEDFSLNKRKLKKKRKKVKSKRTSKGDKDPRKPRSKIVAPSFDQVMAVQINHAQKFVNYDEYDSESSSIIDEHDLLNETMKVAREKSTILTEPKEKRKKIIIYPWRPIGITGGRPPINDSSELN